MNGIIYMRISPNGERYVGQTAKPEEVRWKEHVRESKLKRQVRFHTPLNAAIRKYGGDSFSVVILEDGIETSEKLNEREEYWIKEKHTLISENRGGLNATIGGLGHRLFTKDDFQDLFDQGLSLGQISEITGAATRTIKDHLNSSKLENYKRGRKRALEKDPPRSVSCYDIETCERIGSFSSTIEATIFFAPGQKNSSVIMRAIKGEARSAYGYLWKYDDQPMDVIYNQQKRYYQSKGYSTKRQPVVNVETNKAFCSINKAGKHYNIDGRRIQECCVGKRETAGGFHWKFKDGDIIPFKKEKDGRYKPVICLETGNIYIGVKEASVKSGIYINVLRDCLKKRTDSAGGYHWEYYTE